MNRNEQSAEKPTRAQPAMQAGRQKPYMVLSSMGDDDTGEVHIYGYIVSWAWPEWNETSAKMVRDALNAVKDARVLNVYVDSPGGYLDEGMSIMQEIGKHGAATKNAYLGECCSAATLPPLACDNIYAYEGSEIMIHNPRASVSGTPKEIIGYGEGLLKRAASVAELYQKRMSGKTLDEVQAMMDAETWFTPQEAVDIGFCNGVIEVVPGSGVTMCREETDAYDMRRAAEMFGYTRAPAMSNPHAHADDKGKGSNAPNGAIFKESGTQKDDQEGKTIMTLDELKKSAPEVYAEAVNAGVTMERARLRELDEIDSPEHAEMIRDAKYGEHEEAMTARDVAFAIMKEKPKKSGGSYLEKRKQETQAMAKVRVGASGDNDADDEKELKAFAKMADSWN